MATEQQFTDWIRAARKGDRFVYFTGPHLPDSKSRDPEHRNARRIGNAAYEAHQAGLVALARRRVSPGADAFEFIAQRTGQPVSVALPKAPAKAPAKVA